MTFKDLPSNGQYKLYTENYPNEVYIHIRQGCSEVNLTPEEVEDIYQTLQKLQKGLLK